MIDLKGRMTKKSEYILIMINFCIILQFKTVSLIYMAGYGGKPKHQ